MSKDIMNELKLEELRKYFLQYTKKAYQLLPKMNKPKILDIGCGSGLPTIELAKLSEGEIIGIDIDQDALNELNEKASTLGLSDRVKAENCSLFKINFPIESFDIIWAEGAIAPIGFEGALRKWRRLLKPNGYMVLHDDLGNKEEKLKIIPECGYKLIDYFQLPDDEWWVEYYEPLEKRIKELSAKYGKDPNFLDVIKQHQDEINECKRNPNVFRSIYFIIQKTN
ncbi:MAG: class I SAM-dependent methyltransferase [Candidatus Thorarchaeota archaeon]